MQMTIIILDNEKHLKRTTSKLIGKGEKIGLMVDEGKTKSMIITRRNHKTRKLEVHNYNLERVADFKYLGIDIIENVDSREEINLRLVAENKCHFALIPLLKLKMLTWRMKITLHKILVRLIALYACDA